MNNSNKKQITPAQHRRFRNKVKNYIMLGLFTAVVYLIYIGR